MRSLLGFLSGVVGMLAGWFGLAMAVIVLAGHDQDGGIAMGAFFEIGPIGAIVGFALGVWLFVKLGVVKRDAAPAKTRISRPFAVVVLAIVGGLAFLGWYTLIRSPYLTHGFMTLALQFRLPPNVSPPGDGDDIRIILYEGGGTWPANLPPGAWLGHQGDRAVILANVTMSYKTSSRMITLSMPGAATQSWRIDLASDPDPTPDYTTWTPSSRTPDAIEMNYRLTEDQ